MAEEAVKIYDIIQGKKPKEDLTLIPVGLITKENVDRYAGWTK
jgi:ABC-type sugar transport system substrate-binding protein